MKYDISGPAGNVFAIIGQAKSWAKQVWPKNKEKQEEIESLIGNNSPVKDYDGVLDYIEKMFNGSVEFTGRNICMKEEE